MLARLPEASSLLLAVWWLSANACAPFSESVHWKSPLEEGIFRSADQLLQSCLETASGTSTLLHCKLWVPDLTAASLEPAPAQL